MPRADGEAAAGEQAFGPFDARKGAHWRRTGGGTPIGDLPLVGDDEAARRDLARSRWRGAQRLCVVATE